MFAFIALLLASLGVFTGGTATGTHSSRHASADVSGGSGSSGNGGTPENPGSTVKVGSGGGSGP